MKKVREIAWSRVQTIKLAKALIDRSILVSRRDMYRLRKTFSAAEHVEIIKYFASSLTERKLQLINYEKNLESAVLWLDYLGDDSLVQAFVVRLCRKDSEEALRNLIFVTLSPNSTMVDESHRLNSFTVAIICRIGSYLYTEKRDSHRVLFERVSAHLLSISDTSNMSVRLLLFNYFAAINTLDSESSRHFAKIVRRFGCTVLEHVFSLLQSRKSEALAVEYLRLNIPAILRGDYFMQQTLQSVLVNHLYRFPKRSTLFLRVLSRELITTHRHDRQVLHSWLRHVANLYPAAAEINDRSLAADFWDVFTQFPRDDYFHLVIHRLHGKAKLSNYYRDKLSAILDAKLIERDGKVLPLGVKIERRRGRQPTMAKMRKPLSLLQLSLWIGEQYETPHKLRAAS